MPSKDSHDRSERRAVPPLPALLAVNAALLVLLAAVTFTPAADAQARVRGQYTMVSGGAAGTVGDIVYIVDTINQEMIAVNYEYSTKRLRGVGHRNIAADIADMSRRGPTP
jgi:hypothetical protein